MIKNPMSIQEVSYCACGCERAFPTLDYRHRPRKYLWGHNARRIGETHYNWRGGRRKDVNGYVIIRTPGHPRAHTHGYYVLEHVLVMEQHIGRYLYDNEVVHHKDGNRQNNNIENLELMTRSDHSILHKGHRHRF